MRTVSKTEFCKKLAVAMNDFGYPSIRTEHVAQIVDAWVGGRRGHDLPHGVVGLFVEKELEDAPPGAIALLR